MKEFVGVAETEVASVTNLYSIAVNICLKNKINVRVISDHFSLLIMCSSLLFLGQGRNADALALYFGEDPARCPFEQGNMKNCFFLLVTFDIADC